MPKTKFDIEKHFEDYVARGFHGSKPSDLPKIQEQELRRAFYMSWVQCLFCVRDDVVPYGEEAGSVILDGMIKQVERFLAKEEIDNKRKN